jgi:type I restriction-modification system DNA methylase subunit/predicted type IV restriction endonuclease
MLSYECMNLPVGIGANGMPAPATIIELIERFIAHMGAYQSGQYNEAQLREEFINPFFEALGWDVRNLKGYSGPYQEVIHEDAIKIGGRTKAPDYCFRAGGGQRSFFVEAKKPSVDIAEAAGPAYQLRRYAWSAKLPVSILTNFEEFAVYDCRIRPDRNDRAAVARVIFLSSNDYVSHWDELFNLFSPEAIRRGSLERFIINKKVKKGTAEVDVSFLEEFESWRIDLALNVALRNPGISERDLNFTVQRTIDRIVFLRICEDRGIEPYGTLESLQNGPKVYHRLCELFRRADDRYNSGIFHFSPEKDRPEPPDEMTLSLEIDDKPLKNILGSLYFPISPYEFSVFPIEILGQVYEQFLGKVIRLTKGHRAKVEEKPEVRKAGGVYYTPSYIVDYIVRQTVGKLLQKDNGETITPKQAEKMKILDPACGSGSFLIGVYSFLLDWHREWYVNHDPEKHARAKMPKLYRGATGNWRLTTFEKKRILLNNIYGVDIDQQAVEVTKLSLLLKVLEGESGETLANQLRIFHDRALPDLGGNIKCGNSLIGPDLYAGRQLSFLDKEEFNRINILDWRKEFPGVLKTGGFDAVIGNPPWVMAGYRLGGELDYLKSRYRSAEGKFDLYYLFLEMSIGRLKKEGSLGMIVPNKFFHTRAARNLRSYLSSERKIHTIVDFGYEKLFAGATNYSCVLLMEALPKEKIRYVRATAGLNQIESYDVSWDNYSDAPWHFAEERARNLFLKIEKANTPLENIVDRFGTGVQSGADKILILDGDIAKKLKLEKGFIQSCLRGRDVRRYWLSQQPKCLVFPYEVKNNNYVLCDENKLQSKYSRIYAYLEDHKNSLSKRLWFGKNAKQLSGKWFGMMYLDAFWTFAKPHLLTPSLSNKSNFTLGDGSLFSTGTAGVTSVIPKDTFDTHYLLGVLNSSLISLYALSHSPVFQGGYHKFSAPYLKKIPIHVIDFSNKQEKDRHAKMVDLVETMLDLHKKVETIKTPHEKTVHKRLIDATDRQIDRLVYELYGLTEEEIALVEQSKTE